MNTNNGNDDDHSCSNVRQQSEILPAPASSNHEQQPNPTEPHRSHNFNAAATSNNNSKHHKSVKIDESGIVLPSASATHAHHHHGRTHNEPISNNHNIQSESFLDHGMPPPQRNMTFSDTLRLNIANFNNRQSSFVALDHLTNTFTQGSLHHPNSLPANNNNNQNNNNQGGGGGTSSGFNTGITSANTPMFPTSAAAHGVHHVTRNLSFSRAPNGQSFLQHRDPPHTSHRNSDRSSTIHNGSGASSTVNVVVENGEDDDDDDDDEEAVEEHLQEDFRMRRQETVNFARTAVEDYGYLDPMELAMLQAEEQQHGEGDDEEMISAAEILAAIELLNEKEFALLSEATNKQLSDGLANALMYNGSAWYLPQVSECLPDEEQTAISFTMNEGLAIALCGSRITINIFSLMIRLAMLVFFWWMMWLALPPSLMQPGGYIFDPIVCFLVCSLVGGILGRLFGMPPLVFILGMSIFWSNVGGYSYLTSGIVKPLRSIISKTGLTIILLRSGLSMSWKTIKPAAPNILSMAVLPSLVEIIAHGYTAGKLMDYGEDAGLWPFLQSMTCAPAASAVVGATVLLMRTWDFGNTRGPGILLLPSAVLDMVLGIWGINFMISLVFREPGTDIGWLIGQAPLNIVLGPVIGLLCGFLWYFILIVLFKEAKLLPHGKYSRSFIRRAARNAVAIFTIMGLVLVFFGYKYGCAGGAGLAVAFLGATAADLLTRDDAPEHYKIVKGKMYSYLTSFWDLWAMTLLFSVGATSMFEADFFWRALVCVLVGVSARIFTCFVCSWSYDMTPSERIIGCIASAGRATVQVALGSLSIDRVAALPGGGTPEQVKYANQVYDTSIIGVLLMTPVAVTLLTRVAPRFWLTDAQHRKLQRREKRRLRAEKEAKGESFGEELHSDHDGEADEGEDEDEEHEEATDPSTPQQANPQENKNSDSRPPSALRTKNQNTTDNNNNVISSLAAAAPQSQTSRPPSRNPRSNVSRPPSPNNINDAETKNEKSRQGSVLRVRKAAAFVNQQKEAMQLTPEQGNQINNEPIHDDSDDKGPSLSAGKQRFPRKSPLAQDGNNNNGNKKPLRTPLARDAFNRPQYHQQQQQEQHENTNDVDNVGSKNQQFQDWDIPMYQSPDPEGGNLNNKNEDASEERKRQETHEEDTSEIARRAAELVMNVSSRQDQVDKIEDNQLEKKFPEKK